jgi:hypothetical protein
MKAPEHDQRAITRDGGISVIGPQAADDHSMVIA